MAKSKRPDDDTLRTMAEQPGMTFAQMGRTLQVDRKTVRRWCRDIGVNKCGESTTKDESKPKTVSEETLTGFTDEEFKALGSRISWLIEWHTIIHDRLKALEEGMLGASCSFEWQQDGARSNRDQLIDMVTDVVNKIETGKPFTDEEKVFLDDFKIICQAVMSDSIDLLHGRIYNHYHACPSVKDTNIFFQERRAK